MMKKKRDSESNKISEAGAIRGGGCGDENLAINLLLPNGDILRGYKSYGANKIHSREITE